MRDFLREYGIEAMIVACIFGIVAAIAVPNLTRDPVQDAGLAQRVPIARRADRFVDDEAGVVCYLYRDIGITCLPLSETRLAQPERP